MPAYPDPDPSSDPHPMSLSVSPFAEDGASRTSYLRFDDLSITSGVSAIPVGPVGPAGPSGPAGADGAPGPVGPPPPPGVKMSVRVVGSAAKVVNGVAPVPVSCAGTSLKRCVGTLVLKVGGIVQKGAAYSVVSGKRTTVGVALGSRALRALSRSKSGVSTLAVSRTEQDSHSAVRSTRTLLLR